MSYSFPIHVLFISYSLRIQLPFIPMHFLFISYSFPIGPISLLFILIRFFSCPWIKIQKSKDLVLLAISLFKKQFICSPKSIGKGGYPTNQKKRLTKWVVKKVWGLDGQPFPMSFLFISLSCPIQSWFISRSCPIHFLSILVPFISNAFQKEISKGSANRDLGSADVLTYSKSS